MRDSLPNEKSIEVQVLIQSCHEFGWGAYYLQPAADNRRAYILPMSPMPMIPMVKPSMSFGTWVAGA